LKINPQLCGVRFISDRGRFLKHKQLLKHYFFGLRERQLRYYIVKAARHTRRMLDSLSLDFFSYLERRLDSLLWRSGLFFSARYLRQMIRHNFVRVNDLPISYPSYLVKVGDTVSLDPLILSKMFSFLLVASQRFQLFMLHLLQLVYGSRIADPFSLRRERNYRRHLNFFNKLRYARGGLNKKIYYNSRFLTNALFYPLRWLSFRGAWSKRTSLLIGDVFSASLSRLTYRSDLYRFCFMSSFLKGRFFKLLRVLFFPFRFVSFNSRVCRYDFSSFSFSMVFRPNFFKYPFPMEVRILFNLYTGFF